MHKQQTIYNK
uniref:Uncharacterized protein n=1 Tax=Rhizophora mucronata TaxID=61149 RepID=A0A2P2J826_RHIMU